MQSRTSFFNWSLYKKNITRFWSLWAAVSILGSLMPLALLLNSLPMSINDTTDLYYTVLTTAAPLIGIGYALPCAIAVWSYLHQARSVGMMHSLPIRRESLFVTGTLSGLTMFLIPYIIVGAMTILVTCVRGEVSTLVVLKAIGACAGDGLLFFSIATLAAMVSGSAFMAVALYFVWNFLAVALEGLYNAYASGFLFGVSSAYQGKLNFLSPVVCLLEKVQTEHIYYETPEGFSRTKEILLHNYWVVGAYALAGAAILVLSYFLYRRRHSETAGDAVAVKALRPVFLYAVAVVSALTGGVAFYTLLFSGLFNTGEYGWSFEGYRLLPMLLCMALGATLGYFGARMILKKSTRVFDRRGFIGCGAVLLACIIFCVGLKMDVFGVVRRVPEASEVESAHVIVESLDIDLTKEDTELLDRTLTAHAAVVADMEKIPSWLDSTEDICNFRVSYTLTNGKTLARDYILPISENGSLGSFEELLRSFANSEAFLLRSIHADEENYVLDSVGVYWEGIGYEYEAEEGESYSDFIPNEYYELSSAESQRVFDAIAEDIHAGYGVWLRDDCFAVHEAKGLGGSYIDLNFRKIGGENEYEWDSLTIWSCEKLPATVAVLQELGYAK